MVVAIDFLSGINDNDNKTNRKQYNNSSLLILFIPYNRTNTAVSANNTKSDRYPPLEKLTTMEREVRNNDAKRSGITFLLSFDNNPYIGNGIRHNKIAVQSLDLQPNG